MKSKYLYVAALIILAVGCVLLARNLSEREKQVEVRPDFPISAEFGDLLDVRTNPTLPAVRKDYTGMNVSFNPKAHIPNWVAWELTDRETEGVEKRSDKFVNDMTVEGCAESWDYSYSGYDRGHMAPAGDMKWDRKAMDETFYLTNICPQAKALNVGAWRTLEEKCRQWARRDGSLFIICGPVMGRKPVERIGDSRVWVPDSFFKVIIAPYADPPRGIGFLMPNKSVKGGMQTCVVSIDSVEKVTGHDFFHSLPDGVEDEIESQHKLSQWNYSKSGKNRGR